MNYAELASLIISRPWAIEAAAAAALCREVAMAVVRGQVQPEQGAAPSADAACAPTYAEGIDAAVTPQNASAIARKEGRVAVLPVRGTILPRAATTWWGDSYGFGLDQFSKAITGLQGDSSVKATLLDISSLGGSVEGVREAGELIRELREAKPIVAQVNHRAASAAYWLAAQASEVVVSPSGDVGSIGVITMHANWKKAYADMGVDVTVMTSSGAPFKAEGNPYEELSEEAKASIQADLDAFESMFHEAVAAGRGRKVAEVREGFGQGRMVLAEEAVKRGMADRVATL